MGITRPETLVQEALAPEKMAEAQHTAMPTKKVYKAAYLTSPLLPTGEEWDHPPLRGWPRRVQHRQSEE
jgi:hypothetical protein